MTTGGPHKPKITETERTQLRDKAFAHLDQFITDKTERGTTRLSVMGEILKKYPTATQWNDGLQKAAEEYLLEKLKDINLEGDEALHKEFIKAFMKNKKVMENVEASIKNRKVEPKSGELRDVSLRSQQKNEPEVEIDYAKTEEAKRKIVAENAAKIKAAADKQTAQQKTTEDLAKTQGQEAVSRPIEQTPIKKEYFQPLNPEKATPKTNQKQIDSLLGKDEPKASSAKGLFKGPPSMSQKDNAAKKALEREQEISAAAKRAEYDKARKAREAEENKQSEIEKMYSNKDAQSKAKGLKASPYEKVDSTHPFYKEITDLEKELNKIVNKKGGLGTGTSVLGFQLTNNEAGRKQVIENIQDVLIHTRFDKEKPDKSLEILKSRIEGAIGANKEFRAGPGITDNLSSILDTIKEKAEKLEPKKSKSFLEKAKDTFSTKPKPPK